MIDAHLGLLIVVVLVAFTSEAMAGFGSIIISVTLGAHFMPIAELVPLLVPLNLVLASYMVARYHGHVAFGLLLRRVLPLVGIGLAVGQLLFHQLAGPALQVGLGVLVLCASGAELIRMVRGGSARALGAFERAGWLLGAGVVHGVYATGGPPLVYALGRAGLDKRAFRSTLATLWFILDVALIASFTASGRLTGETLRSTALLIPVVAVAIGAGELLHHRIDERRFRMAAFSLLLFAGAALLV